MENAIAWLQRTLKIKAASGSMQYPVSWNSRNLSRESRRPAPITFDRYKESGINAPEERRSPGGANSVVYRGGYSHEAGSFNIIHGGN